MKKRFEVDVSRLSGLCDATPEEVRKCIIRNSLVSSSDFMKKVDSLEVGENVSCYHFYYDDPVIVTRLSNF